MKFFLRSLAHAPALPVAALMLAAVTASASAINYSFQTLDNPGDPAFNQLLGINNAGEIAGYFGDGAMQPNKGYTLAPAYTAASYTNENFPNSVQTQVVGINNNAIPATVGFYIDAQGNNLGFFEQNGAFVSIFGPDIPATGTAVTQILGINDSDIMVGFDTDAMGNNHGIVDSISTLKVMPFNLPSSFN
ncbi:MAG: hypothetical protein ABI165_13685, partial [Bryobacteraceae bacterium]